MRVFLEERALSLPIPVEDRRVSSHSMAAPPALRRFTHATVVDKYDWRKMGVPKIIYFIFIRYFSTIEISYVPCTYFQFILFLN